MIQTTPLMNNMLNNMGNFTYNAAMPSLFGMNSYMPMMPMMMPMMPNFGSIFNFSMPSSNSVSNSGSSSKSQETSGQGYNANVLNQLFKECKVPAATQTKIVDAVTRACKQYNVDPKFVFAVMYRESKFNPNAKSPCGAMGLMQLMPSTAKSYGVTNGYDIEQSIQGGVKMLSKMLQRYNGDKTLAAAAYNAGPGRVKNSVPKIKETQKYVVDVNSTMKSLA